jgi:hypothetical protein
LQIDFLWIGSPWLDALLKERIELSAWNNNKCFLHKIVFFFLGLEQVSIKAISTREEQQGGSWWGT